MKSARTAIRADWYCKRTPQRLSRDPRLRAIEALVMRDQPGDILRLQFSGCWRLLRPFEPGTEICMESPSTLSIELPSYRPALPSQHAPLELRSLPQALQHAALPTPSAANQGRSPGRT